MAAYRPHQQPEFLQRGYGFEALKAYLQQQVFADLALASVAASELTETYASSLSNKHKKLVIAETQNRFWYCACYANPSTYGVDRWLTLLAGKSGANKCDYYRRTVPQWTLDVMDESRPAL